MEISHDQAVAVAKFERGHADWDEMIRSIGLDRMEEPGLMGEWSAKDLIAHISGWQWKTIAGLHAALTGGDFPATPWPAEWNDPANWYEDGQVEPINTWIHERAATYSVDDVIQNSREQWAAMRQIIGGLSADQLKDPNLFPQLGGRALGETLISGDFFGHIDEHMADDVNPWLAEHGHRY